MSRTILILCECCALVLADDDDSGCRDHHRHGHEPLAVPDDTVISQGPHTWDGTLDLTCHGHHDGVVHPGQAYWVAEVFAAPAGDEAA